MGKWKVPFHLTVQDAARDMAKPTKEELAEVKQLRDLAEEEAKKQIIAEQKEQEIRKEIGVIELETINASEFDVKLAEPDESEEEIKEEMETVAQAFKENSEEKRRKQQTSDRTLVEHANKVWSAICNHDPLDAINRERIARLVIAMLYKKYPRLMDEV
jgi:hypothetical protein